MSEPVAGEAPRNELIMECDDWVFDMEAPGFDSQGNYHLARVSFVAHNPTPLSYRFTTDMIPPGKRLRIRLEWMDEEGGKP